MRIALVLLLVAPFTVAIGVAGFANQNTLFAAAPPAVATAAIAWADFNNDGRQDVALGGSNGGTCYLNLYKNTGTSLTDVAASLSLPAASGASTLQWADFNKDGWLDILIYGTCTGSSVQLFKNTQTAFASVSLPTTPASTDGGTGVFVDFDSDTWMDIVLTSGGTPTLYFFRNKGDGTFEDVSSTWGSGVTALGSGTLAFSDYNRDGKPDMFLTGNPQGSTTPNTQVYKNSGTGFTSVSTVLGSLLSGITASRISFADYNRDSFEDFLVIGVDGSANKHTQLFVNNQNGTFSDTSALLHGLAGLSGGDITWGDYNGDMYPDFYVQGAPTTSKLFQNIRGTDFVDSTTEAFPGSILTAISGGAARFGDCDGDGLVDDLLIAGTDAGSTVITPQLFFSNATPIRKPAAPSPVQVSVTGTGSTRTVTITTYVRADPLRPIDSFELVVTPNGGKATKPVPQFNSKSVVQFTMKVDNIPVLSSLRKVWVRGINKAGKGAWAQLQVTF